MNYFLNSQLCEIKNSSNLIFIIHNTSGVWINVCFRMEEVYLKWIRNGVFDQDNLISRLSWNKHVLYV